jgi:hypothetical protein
VKIQLERKGFSQWDTTDQAVAFARPPQNRTLRPLEGQHQQRCLPSFWKKEGKTKRRTEAKNNDIKRAREKGPTHSESKQEKEKKNVRKKGR